MMLTGAVCLGDRALVDMGQGADPVGQGPGTRHQSPCCPPPTEPAHLPPGTDCEGTQAVPAGGAPRAVSRDFTGDAARWGSPVGRQAGEPCGSLSKTVQLECCI